MPTLSDLRADARSIFNAALRAADPHAAVLRVLHRRGSWLLVDSARFDLSRGDVFVVGAGKAGASMAQPVEELLGNELRAGAVIVKYDHGAPTRRVQVHEAGHPLPD